LQEKKDKKANKKHISGLRHDGNVYNATQNVLINFKYVKGCGY